MLISFRETIRETPPLPPNLQAPKRGYAGEPRLCAWFPVRASTADDLRICQFNEFYGLYVTNTAHAGTTYPGDPGDMTTTPITFPRSQHWTIDGFRITVLVYKSHRSETRAVWHACDGCRQLAGGPA